VGEQLGPWTEPFARHTQVVEAPVLDAFCVPAAFVGGEEFKRPVFASEGYKSFARNRAETDLDEPVAGPTDVVDGGLAGATLPLLELFARLPVGVLAFSVQVNFNRFAGVEGAELNEVRQVQAFRRLRQRLASAVAFFLRDGAAAGVLCDDDAGSVDGGAPFVLAGNASPDS
jgi:hypothetical protein